MKISDYKRSFGNRRARMVKYLDPVKLGSAMDVTYLDWIRDELNKPSPMSVFSPPPTRRKKQKEPTEIEAYRKLLSMDKKTMIRAMVEMQEQIDEEWGSFGEPCVNLLKRMRRRERDVENGELKK
jgi:Xaa-Pro aminopeptidase